MWSILRVSPSLKLLLVSVKAMFPPEYAVLRTMMASGRPLLLQPSDVAADALLQRHARHPADDGLRPLAAETKMRAAGRAHRARVGTIFGLQRRAADLEHGVHHVGQCGID